MAKTKYLSRRDVLEVDDRPIVDVEVPEWGGIIRVRGLSGDQRDLYLGSLLVNPGIDSALNLEKATVKLVSKCVVAENGSPLFTEADIAQLGRKNGMALNRVYELASEISGLNAKDIKKITQSLGQTQNGDSTSS